MINKQFTSWGVIGVVLVVAALYFVYRGHSTGKGQQGVNMPAPSAAGIPADLPWGHVRYNFSGNIVSGDSRLVDLDIYPANPGVPVENVARLASSCGCLHPIFKDISNQKTKGIHLSATFLAHGKGDNHQYIRLLSAMGKCLGVVEVISTVVPRFAITPDIIDFKSVRPHSPSMQCVEIKSNVYPVKSWSIVEAPEWLSLDITAQTPISAKIICRLKPSIIPGTLDTKVRLVPINQKADEVILHIAGNVQGEIMSMPETLLIGPVVAGSRAVTHFRVQKVNKKANIEELIARTTSPGLRILLKKDEKQGDWAGTAILQTTTSSKAIQRGEVLLTDKQGRQYLRIPYRITLIE